MVKNSEIKEPDFNEKIINLESRFSKLEGAFYQFQFTFENSEKQVQLRLESSEKWMKYLYRITFTLIILGIIGIFGIIADAVREIYEQRIIIENLKIKEK